MIGPRVNRVRAWSLRRACVAFAAFDAPGDVSRALGLPFPDSTIWCLRSGTLYSKRAGESAICDQSGAKHHLPNKL